jgi:hypothetical protein
MIEPSTELFPKPAKQERGVILANSFTRGEVKLMNQLFRTLRSGGDPRMLLRALHSVEGKFQRMQRKAEAAP